MIVAVTRFNFHIDSYISTNICSKQISINKRMIFFISGINIYIFNFFTTSLLCPL